VTNPRLDLIGVLLAVYNGYGRSFSIEGMPYIRIYLSLIRLYPKPKSINARISCPKI
jgi:hypothetical protein